MNEALFLLSIIYPSFPCTFISRTGFVIKMEIGQHYGGAKFK